MNAFDATIMTFISGFYGKSWTFDTVMDILLTMNLAKGGVVIAVLWGLWFAAGEEKAVDRKRRAILAAFAGTLVAVFLIEFLVRVLPFRARPRFEPDALLAFPFSMQAVTASHWSAFPSDHAAMFTALAVGVFLVSRRLGFLSLAYVFVVVLFPRVYMGLHYPTDILAGALLGAVVVALLSRSGAMARGCGRILSWSGKYPVPFYGLFFLFSYEMISLFWNLRVIGKFGLELLRAVAGRHL